jgi:hypothetical protein
MSKLMACESLVLSSCFTINPFRYRKILTYQGIILKCWWQFNNKCGAILVMYKPKLTQVSKEFFMASTLLPVLKRKCVVNSV